MSADSEGDTRGMQSAAIHEKVWGFEEWIVNTPDYCGKRLVLNKGWRCSMHHHRLKDETFYVAYGVVRLETETFEGERMTHRLGAGGSLRIEPGTWHRFTGVTDAVMFEFSTHHEDDDSYRRVPSGRADDQTG
jgi:quercetin dioxygenase-like cupin family protein